MLLEVKPEPTETLETRRRRVRFLWNNPIPYTDKALETRLIAIVGNEYTITRDYDNYTLTIAISLGIKQLLADVEQGIADMIPANLLFTLELQYNLYEDIEQYTYDQLDELTYRELYDEVLP